MNFYEFEVNRLNKRLLIIVKSGAFFANGSLQTSHIQRNLYTFNTVATE